MKRVLYVFVALALAITLVGTLPPPNKVVTAAPVTCLHVDGEGLANGQAIPGWNVLIDPKATVTTVTASTNSAAVHSGSRGVRVNGDFHLGKALDVVAKGVVTIDYWHFPCPGASTNSGLQIMGQRGDPDRFLSIHKNDQDLWWVEGRQAATYSGGYTHIIVTMNTETGYYDVRINGVPVANQWQVNPASLERLRNGIHYVSFHSGRGALGTSSYFDDLTITSTDTAPNNAPERPTNMSPACGSSNVSLTPTLGSSQFSTADAGDTHAASQWQIRSYGGTYVAPLFDTGTTGSDIVKTTVPSGILAEHRTYWWRVRYQDSNGAWSDWSEETSFTVGPLPILLVHGFQRDKGWTLDDYWRDMVKSLTGDDIGNSENYSWVYNDEDSDSCTFWMKRFDDGNGRVVYISNYTHGESLATDRDIREYAQSLAGEIEVIKKEEQVDQVDIVAHSMGGLVSRAYIESADLALDNPWVVPYKADVRKLIMLGTANSGTPLATTFWADFLANCDENTACQQLAPNSSFLQALNGLGTETGIKNKAEYSAVAGNYFKCWCDDDGCHVLPGPYLGCGQMWVTAKALCRPDYVGLSDGVIPVNSVQLGEIGLSRWFEVPFTHFALNKYTGDLVKKILAAPCFSSETIEIPTSCQARLCSPGELRVYDSSGQITGSVDGVITEEIPGSAFDTAENCVVVFPADDTYRYEVVGSTEGTYGLILTYGEGDEVTHFTAAEIPLALGAVHEYEVDWDALADGGNGVTVRIDVDGDGKFDNTVESDAELTAEEFALAKSVGGGMPFWVWIAVGVAAATVVAVAALVTRRLKKRGSQDGRSLPAAGQRLGRRATRTAADRQ
jgi:pimeloyl-ACP methyl ester carboxylesterase